MTKRLERLPLIYQEFLAGVVKLRAGREKVTDADVFRANVKATLGEGDADARRLGYTDTEIQLARFSVVAFLDETVLNSGLPVFQTWPRKPLQEELFEIHKAGEMFFQNIDRLLRQTDSSRLAEVLEIHYLCLLLGFRGRYGKSSGADLKMYRDQLAVRIARIRGEAPQSEQPLPVSRARIGADAWVGRLMWAAVVCLVVVLLLFAGYKWSLSSRLSELRQMAQSGEARR